MILALSATFADAQVNQKLNLFFSLLNVENLNTEETKIIEINGTVLTTWEMYNSSDEVYYISKFDLVNLRNVQWTSKQVYDKLYPKDKSINKDADFITLLSKKGDVERKSYYTDTISNINIVKKKYSHNLSEWPDCNFVNISFKNSTLAIKAKKYLEAYIAKRKK